MDNKMCGCPHHKMIPIAIVLVGVTFLLGATGTLESQTVNVIWPIIIILVGLSKLFKGMCKCCDK